MSRYGVETRRDHAQEDPRLKELRDRLNELLQKQLESLKADTFVGLTEEELRQQDERLHRIREVSADLLALLKEDLH
jgi:hypothetical protein